MACPLLQERRKCYSESVDIPVCVTVVCINAHINPLQIYLQTPPDQENVSLPVYHLGHVLTLYYITNTWPCASSKF